MNDLDRQLAELALINKSELTPNSTGGKKIGPAVPPKPKKPQPQIPQSYPLKQTLEPSYSSRLQTNQFYSNLPQQQQQQQQQPLQEQNLYVNQQQYSNLPAPLKSNINSVPKAYSKPDNVTYSNLQKVPNDGGLIYCNLIHPSPNSHPQQPQQQYCNVPGKIPTNGNSVVVVNDDLPPPPPPLELSQQNLSDYQPCTVNTNLPPPPDDLLPPPSPVSSSYSELRRATQPSTNRHLHHNHHHHQHHHHHHQHPHPQDYNYLGSQYADSSDSLYGYGAVSQTSSTYESIYEPINPRPPSQMSSRSNYSLYAPYISGGSNSSTLTGPSQSVSRIGNNKEQEVDNLTDLLVQGMVNRENLDQDVYGVCVKCGDKIVGENSGCTAMDQLYHTKCFTCHQCAINLQGKPFYALDGQPYCEVDYLNTLEKCCVCQHPILDRILRATGKPYHPKCFCCVVCGKSLDGIPFTVDATNRVHCIEDFHKIFAPRCWVCKQPIMPEPGEEETVRVVALDHSFHIQCYKCEDCGLVLSSEAEGRGCYPLDGHVLCKSCNAKRVQALTSHMTTEL